MVDGPGAHTIDTGDTVGLLSSIYPVRLDSDDPHKVAEKLASIPGDGLDFGLLRYLRTTPPRGSPASRRRNCC